MKKNTWRYIILNMCTKNHDKMMYSSWNMVHDRCNYFSIWVIFCPFTLPPLTAQKIKILKKWKKYFEISSFYICVPKIMIRWCTVPEICCMTDRRTNRRTDGWKKWHIKVGAPPKNIQVNWMENLLKNYIFRWIKKKKDNKFPKNL